jgi:hypothetical protein
MHTRSVRLWKAIEAALVGIIFWLCFAVGVTNAQTCPPMPPGLLCITHTAGNNAAANARELEAQRQKVAVLEGALRQKDVTIEEWKKTNADNVERLTNRIMAVTAEAALEKGRREQLEADKVFWTEIIKVAIANTREKTNGIKIFDF